MAQLATSQAGSKDSPCRMTAPVIKTKATVIKRLASSQPTTSTSRSRATWPGTRRAAFGWFCSSRLTTSPPQ